MPDDRKNLAAEVAGLTEAVRELRDREVAEEIGRLREEIAALRAQQPAHHCHGNCCVVHWYYTPTWIGGAAGYPNTVYYTTPTVTAGDSAGSATLTQDANACNGGNTLTLSGYQPNAAAGGGYGTWTVPMGTASTTGWVDTAGAAPVAGSYVVNCAGC